MARAVSVVLAIFALLAPPAAAQPPWEQAAELRAKLTQEIERKLRSPEPETVAWGAFEAGVYRVRGAVPALQRMLETPLPRRDDRIGWAILDVVLDALVQLQARLPAPLVARYLDTWPVHACILLTTASDREDVLVEQLRAATGFRWYVAANLLLDDRSAPLAAHLLQTVRLRLTITVSEGGNRHTGSSDGLGTTGVGHGIGQNPPGFPPRATYRFDNWLRPELVVLTSGPRPVFYSRAVHTGHQYGASTLSIGGPTDEDRVAYLHAMLPPGTAPIVKAHTQEVAAWTTPEALLERAAELRRDLEDRFRLMRSSLERTFELAAVSAPASIDVRLVDARADRSVPLPPSAKVDPP
jgi:hypothetical protein